MTKDTQTADVRIRSMGRAGHITLNRPSALNALTADMSVTIENALDTWREDTFIDLIILDAEEPKAFCAGGDIAYLYANGNAGKFELGRAFWRQEYRLNQKIATYPKPVVVFMQGFTMGGGVGLAGHASHRIVGESSKVAMPECGIGMIPDVGGSFILARAPGQTGAYLGLTGTRMEAEDAIYATFADHFVPETDWESLKSVLAENADVGDISDMARTARGGFLKQNQNEIHELFSGQSPAEIHQALSESGTDFAQSAAKKLVKGAPLALACALRTIRAARDGDLSDALAREFRFSYRSQDQGDFIEGIRAQIIDRDFTPKWLHATLDVPKEDVKNMLADLGPHEWTATGDAA